MGRRMITTVFGGSGFLGSHVADVWSEVGHCARIFDRNLPPRGLIAGFRRKT